MMPTHEQVIAELDAVRAWLVEAAAFSKHDPKRSASRVLRALDRLGATTKHAIDLYEHERRRGCVDTALENHGRADRDKTAWSPRDAVRAEELAEAAARQRALREARGRALQSPGIGIAENGQAKRKRRRARKSSKERTKGTT